MSANRRLLSVEFLKAIAIIYLIVLNQVAWLFIQRAGQPPYLSYKIFYFFCYYSGFHLLGFQLPVLAGLTFYLSFKSKSKDFFTVFKRAAILLLLGFLTNLLSWGPNAIFDWDILSLIALSMMITFIFLKLCSNTTGPVIVFILGLIALFLSNQFPVDQYSSHYAYKVLIGDKMGKNSWPICPWFSLFATGVFIGAMMNLNDKKKLSMLSLTGFFLMGVSVFSGHFFPQPTIRSLLGVDLFKPSPFFVCGILGFSLIIIPLMQRFFETNVDLKKKIQNSFIVYYGQGVLWVYIFSTILGYNLTQEVVMRMFRVNYSQALVAFPILVFLHLILSYRVSKQICYKREVVYQ